MAGGKQFKKPARFVQERLTPGYSMSVSPHISNQQLTTAIQSAKHHHSADDAQYYKEKYNISQHDWGKQEKRFCIVIPTYNNQAQDRYYYNLQSILNQKYENYHIVIVDDASTDLTYIQIQQMIGQSEEIFDYEQEQDEKKKKQMERLPEILLIKSQEKRFALGSILNASKYCKQEEIMMIVDGDDQLIGYNVLRMFSHVFDEYDVWMAYSNHINSNHQIGNSKPYPPYIQSSNSFREYPLLASHLRCFYVKLFNKIDESDLYDEGGRLFHAANDISLVMPMLEMANDRILYIPEIMYAYNSNTGLNNEQVKREEQVRNDNFIRKKLKYKRLRSLE